MKTRNYDMVIRLSLLAVFIVIIFVVSRYQAGVSVNKSKWLLPLIRKIDSQDSAAPMTVSSPYLYTFMGSSTLQEKNSMDQSGSPYWWLNSGGEMAEQNGIGATIQGDLPMYDKWRLEYANSNAVDTDNGYHPQNLFRLVSRQKWLNYRQEVYFEITRDNLSQSYNRNESNGVFLFNRYLDGENLYYVGVRVDGTAVVKKKLRGVYFTLADVPVWGDRQTYDRIKNPDLLPKGQWVGLASEVTNAPDGSVLIALYLDTSGTGNWERKIQVVDDGAHFGLPIRDAGYTGMRTDFMDVLFRHYFIRTL